MQDEKNTKARPGEDSSYIFTCRYPQLDPMLASLLKEAIFTPCALRVQVGFGEVTCPGAMQELRGTRWPPAQGIC